MLDDNLMFGNISEAARSLLVHSDVRNVTFASICNFGDQYLAQNIHISPEANVFKGVLASQWQVFLIFLFLIYAYFKL